MNCLFCNNLIGKRRRKYCSNVCIKRAWYLRNNLKAKSYFAKNPLFWKTETGIGFKWEKYAAKFLKAKHLEFNGSGSDLDWNGKKVDVKVCNLYKRKFKRGVLYGHKNGQNGIWLFNRNKFKPVDFFFCIGLVKNKLIKRWLIPASVFPHVGASIGFKSKYDIYLI